MRCRSCRLLSLFSCVLLSVACLPSLPPTGEVVLTIHVDNVPVCVQVHCGWQASHPKPPTSRQTTLCAYPKKNNQVVQVYGGRFCGRSAAGATPRAAVHHSAAPKRAAVAGGAVPVQAHRNRQQLGCPVGRSSFSLPLLCEQRHPAERGRNLVSLSRTSHNAHDPQNTTLMNARLSLQVLA